MYFTNKIILPAVSCVALLSAGTASAATITGWNTDNVVVGSTPPDGETGSSVVYDQNPSNPGATSSGAIAFTPPEAISPGIQVQPEVYTQGGSDGLTLDGCIMTSNPGATCTSDFQSGKRVKQEMTGTGPVDLVFDIEAGDEANYQVFSRLINDTGQSLDGFEIEIGFGVGDDFVQATEADGITISTEFSASPKSANASVTTQMPFGLFGDAEANPNFTLDGFFAPELTGYDVMQTPTTITSAGLFGPYDGLFGSWMSGDSVPMGAFWDNDNDESTEALLMAWMNPDGLWEMRRDVVDPITGEVVSLSDGDVEYYSSFDDLMVALGLGADLFEDDIEDLANVNINYAINLSDTVPTGSFTLRTTVIAAVPLPLSAPLLAGGLGMLAMVSRRRKRRTA